eukprot:scaffold67264_cov57-Phaeocystis_antarctica.AAC.1
MVKARLQHLVTRWLSRLEQSDRSRELSKRFMPYWYSCAATRNERRGGIRIHGRVKKQFLAVASYQLVLPRSSR